MESSWGSGATSPSTDPIIHLLHRFTYGPTKDLVSGVTKIGADAWFEKQLDHGALADTNNKRYLASYFEGFKGVWTHGDFAAKSVTGGFTLFGRSDATLNSKGVRIGTSEIYRVVETFPEVQEAMAVSQDWEGDTRVILFIVLKPGMSYTQDTEKTIRSALRTQASPRHVPDLIVVAPALPRTKSNKLVELAVTDIVNGREVRNRDALANPEALDFFKALHA